MRILAVSDQELATIYSPQIRERFKDINLVVSCGDLPYYYLEFIISMLDINLYFVRGNHAHEVEYSENGQKMAPWGAVDLHRRAVRDPGGLLLAGMQGSIRYNNGPYQYTQGQMWNMVLGLSPLLMANRILYGRFLDVFITHAPPWQVQDRDDLPHQGFKAFRWFDKVFKPAYHLHGHIHIYRRNEITETQFFDTRVINVFGYKKLEFDLEHVKIPSPLKQVSK
ncbi:MAG: metallophosphoesterase [Anaerolineaceae bacterium]